MLDNSVLRQATKPGVFARLIRLSYITGVLHSPSWAVSCEVLVYVLITEEKFNSTVNVFTWSSSKEDYQYNSLTANGIQHSQYLLLISYLAGNQL